MKVVDAFGTARDEATGVVGLVPTMGYLHEGHLSLVAAARERSDTVVMSLFVNPLQFEDPDDLDRYPRDLERDLALADSAGVDVVFAPTADVMYPDPMLTSVRVGSISDRMEGAHRPGHFEGVATVVTKLLAGLRPDIACFGRKDAQQLALVTRLASDLSFPVEIVGVPILRHADGLALSSRNVRLRGDQREAARGLSRGLFSAADLAAGGERSADVLVETATTVATTAGVTVEYAELATVDDAAPITRLDRPSFLAVAGRVGAVRLIDNVFLWPDGTADRGVTLSGPSVLEGG